MLSVQDLVLQLVLCKNHTADSFVRRWARARDILSRETSFSRIEIM